MPSSSLLEPPESAVKYAAVPPPLPAEVELVISALEAGAPHHDNRRRRPRMRYRVQAEMRLFSDEAGAPPWRLYTRDASVRGIGFITRHRLPLGYGAIVRIPAPDGNPVAIHGTLYRCRDIGNEWFEGAFYFNRDQWVFGDLE